MALRFFLLLTTMVGLDSVSAQSRADCWNFCLEQGYGAAHCRSLCDHLGRNVELGCDLAGCGINPNICCRGNRCVDCLKAPITGNTGALGKGGKGKANIGEDGTDYSEAPMTINYDGRYFKNEKCQSVKDLGKPCGHKLCCGNGYIGFLCLPCPGNTGALGKGGKGKANIGENGMDYSDEDGKLDPTDGLRKGGNNDYELQPSANDYQECGPDCSYGGPHWGPHYPDAKLTNKLKRKISYSMYLACANAYHSGIIEPGKAVSYPRDICLLTEIQVPGCISYKSSGTSYSQFEVRYIQGDAKECQVVRV